MTLHAAPASHSPAHAPGMRDDVRLLVIIPTRNRPDLAARAIVSVLRCERPVRLLVSDNSTREQERKELATFCRDLDDARVQYLRPPTPLPISAHWNWAIQQALQSVDFTHVVYVTDRTVVKGKGLDTLTRIAATWPHRAITFRFDSVYDSGTPIRLLQLSRTDCVFEVSSDDLLASIARVRLESLFYVPGLVNCVTPRAVLERVAARFDGVAGSRIPDVCFGLRYLELYDSVVCYDTTLVVDYAVDRSKSYALWTGKPSEAYNDWLSQLTTGAGAANATPISQLDTMTNLILHEYCVFREETQSPKFPPLDRFAYFRANRNELRHSVDSPARREKQARLDAYTHLFVEPRAASLRRFARMDRRQRWRHLLERVAWNVTQRPASFWHWLERFGLYFPGRGLSPTTFETLGAALEYACNSPRPRNRTWCELEFHTRAKRLAVMPPSLEDR